MSLTRLTKSEAEKTVASRAWMEDINRIKFALNGLQWLGDGIFQKFACSETEGIPGPRDLENKDSKLKPRATRHVSSLVSFQGM